MYRATVSMKIDLASIKRKIEAAVARSPKARRAAYVRAYGLFSSAKRAMLREFDRSNITQEILGGEDAANISGTLGGYGNLFSFIGFHQGDRPTEPLRWMLEQVSMEQTQYRERKWYFRVRVPDNRDIAGVTPMPWEQGNSWALSVEKEISGLSHYLYTRHALHRSRSGTGIQLPYENWEDLQFEGQPYITEILKNFRERVNNAS